MGKPKSGSAVTLTYPATTAYKQWVWREIRSRGKTLQWVVDEMRRVARRELVASGNYETISTASVSLLLGPEGAIPSPSNCAFMPALNKALGLAPPPVCDPTSEAAQLRDRFVGGWSQLTERERRVVLAMLSDDSA